MIDFKKLFRPYLLYSIVGIVQLLVYGFYALGIIPSFKISYVSNNVIGYILLVFYYLIPIFISYITNRNSFQNEGGFNSACLDDDVPASVVLILVYVFFIIGIYGIARVGADLFSKYGVVGSIVYMLTEQRQSDIISGNGNIIRSVFLVAAIILISLIVDFRRKKYIATYIVNLIILFVYSSMIVSRIVFIQGIFFSALILIRRKIYSKSVKIKTILVLVLMVMLLLIISSGYRDYRVDGIRYTGSIFTWGLSRLTDYSISSTNYSLEISKCYNSFDFSFPVGTFPLLRRIVSLNTAGVNNIERTLEHTVGSSEYTNLGGLAYMFFDFNDFFLLYMIFLGCISSELYLQYDKGSLFGICVYPIIAYNILESSRIYFLGTEMAEVLLIIIVICVCIINFSKKIKIGNKINEYPIL